MNSKHQLTKEGYEKILERHKFLVDVERPRIIEALKDARAQGDLSENAEYDAARDEQAKIEQEITDLEEIMRNSTIIEDRGHANNLGKEITIYFEDEKDTMTFTLVSSFLESDPLKGIISRESPLGKAVIEAQIGEMVLVKPDFEPEYYAKIIDIKSK